ncbi:hypothetical protein BU24DRAFT_389213 [Aaosphaeria arxii CBS 175.79]|uniref:Nuclear pore complex protein Nup85 n=1 Tax=Aaosphaeria arxii CBS 175.79 TaxID=1450172 RepID=A0A6A5XYL7_9PLEO|nr:uncharacterized protein BU24DRAFT_389213 [Aaosphaeria arxii CBS 175.79]KAF2017730.1 hypothetical protein BU24DRAFT_389213 [Aaosphaeria arxii CBS 175.79]
MFRVPSSSSPPSTPGYRYSTNDAPSTTPAGPPPGRSFITSSTPAGPPPNDLFSNSHFNMSQPGTFGFNRSALNSSPPKNEFSGVGSGLFGVPTSARPGSQRGRPGFRVPSSSPQHGDEDSDIDAEGSEEYDEEMDEEEDASGSDEDMDDEEDEEDEEEYDDERDDTFAQSRNRNTRFSQSVTSQDGASVLGNTPIVQPGARQTQYDLLSIAKGLTPNLDRTTALRESGDVILETERLLSRLHDSVTADTPEKRAHVIEEVAQELLAVWKSSSQTSKGTSSSGRKSDAPALASVNKIANLLLNLHHPGHIAEKLRGSLFSLVPSRPEARHFTPIPLALMTWLNTYHNTASEVPFVLRETQGYSASERFWDAVQASVLRGNFLDTLKLLKGANFAVAETASQDGLGEYGYTGRHLHNTNIVVRAMIETLERCPVVASDDWDIKGQEWSVFRQIAQRSAISLQEFAEGDSQNSYDASQSFQASHFGISQSQNSFGLSQASRKAESTVPWTVYDNLRKLYNQLLGSEEEIMSMSMDWIEAVICLTVWWNGEDEEPLGGSLAASRRSLARSHRVRDVDVTPVKAYCRRLSAALNTVIESNEEDLSINTTDRYEVGLACIVDDNIEGVLQILRGWSLPCAAAVAEVASAGDWFRRADGLLDQFDQSDLMVLSYNENQRRGVSKDDLLVAYSDYLATQPNLTSQDGKTSREGWELAVQVLGRLDDLITSNEKIQDILNNLSLNSTDRVDKITRLCYDMGIPDHARSIALKYADHLRSSTQNYGDTLLYYARAHNAQKIQEVLRVLVAHCLVKSVAYPPLAELDRSLSTLIASPKATLTELATYDPEGAQLLSNYLAGYATIRRFYDLRDEEILLQANEKPSHRPMARKRAAANALVVIIQSAASSVRGGLYDPEVETVVQVDVLLCLLGEALIFVNQPKRTLTLPHLYTLLAAVEDLDTAPSMIRAQCEEVLSTTLAAAHGDAAKVPSPTSLLQKSTSNLTTASSQYSLIGSTEFGSATDRSTDSSAVLVRGTAPGSVSQHAEKDTAKRAWDWRKGFGKDSQGSDVIRVLRLGIAKELATAFVQGKN